MANVLVLYYSTYGHVAQMADAIAEGAREAGATAVVKRVPSVEGVAVARPDDPQATIDELATYDAIVVGTGTRFGRMSGPMAAFLDQAGGLWRRVRLTARLAARLRPPPRNMVGKKSRCSRSSPTFCISG